MLYNTIYGHIYNSYFYVFCIYHILHVDQKANAFFFGLNFGGRVYTYILLPKHGVIFWSHLPFTQFLIPYFAPYVQLKPIHPLYHQ